MARTTVSHEVLRMLVVMFTTAVFVLLAFMAAADAMTDADAWAAVDQAYRDYLGRPADPAAGVWVTALLGGALSVDAMREAVANSPEATSRPVPPVSITGGRPGVNYRIVLNTLPFRCNQATRQRSFVNDSGRTMVVTDVNQWHGTDYGLIADFHSEVTWNDDGSLVGRPYRHDRYGASVNGTDLTEHFSPPLEIAPGQGWTLTTWCVGFGWWLGSTLDPVIAPVNPMLGHGHVQLDLRWMWR